MVRQEQILQHLEATDCLPGHKYRCPRFASGYDLVIKSIFQPMAICGHSDAEKSVMTYQGTP